MTLLEEINNFSEEHKANWKSRNLTKENQMAGRRPQDEEVPNMESGEPVDAEPEQQVQTRGILGPVKIEPGFFAQRNPKVQVARSGKDRRIATQERRTQDRRSTK